MLFLLEFLLPNEIRYILKIFNRIKKHLTKYDNNIEEKSIIKRILF